MIFPQKKAIQKCALKIYLMETITYMQMTLVTTDNIFQEHVLEHYSGAFTWLLSYRNENF